MANRIEKQIERDKKLDQILEQLKALTELIQSTTKPVKKKGK